MSATTTFGRESSCSWTSGEMTGISHISRIASGGYGEVHKIFARKILRLFGGVHREDIDNEVRAISQLCSAGRCENIVEVIRHGWFPVDDAYYYIDMEYCSETLNDRILGIVPVAESDPQAGSDSYRFIEPENAKVPKPTENPAAKLESDLDDSVNESVSESDLEGYLDILDDIVNALIYIHDSGMVHRDLKPQNVLFSQKDNCWKVADFGTVSDATSRRQNTTYLSRGTASYRAPEILDSTKPRFNNKTDIFALGSIIYEIVTRERLFCDDFAIVNYSVTGTLPSGWWPETIADTSPRLAPLERLVASMLEIDHRRRPSAKEIQTELDNIRFGVNSDLLDTGLPIQRYLISGPNVPEREVPQRVRRNDQRRIPFAKPMTDEEMKKRKKMAAKADVAARAAADAAAAAAAKAKPMKAEDAVLQQMAASQM